MTSWRAKVSNKVDFFLCLENDLSFFSHSKPTSFIENPIFYCCDGLSFRCLFVFIIVSLANLFHVYQFIIDTSEPHSCCNWIFLINILTCTNFLYFSLLIRTNSSLWYKVLVSLLVSSLPMLWSWRARN